MKYIFEKARKELTGKQLDKWIYFAYGILEKNITKTQEELLLKGIEQDKRYEH